MNTIEQPASSARIISLKSPQQITLLLLLCITAAPNLAQNVQIDEVTQEQLTCVKKSSQSINNAATSLKPVISNLITGTQSISSNISTIDQVINDVKNTDYQYCPTPIAARYIDFFAELERSRRYFLSLRKSSTEATTVFGLIFDYEGRTQEFIDESTQRKIALKRSLTELLRSHEDNLPHKYVSQEDLELLCSSILTSNIHKAFERHGNRRNTSTLSKIQSLILSINISNCSESTRSIYYEYSQAILRFAMLAQSEDSSLKNTSKLANAIANPFGFPELESKSERYKREVTESYIAATKEVEKMAIDYKRKAEQQLNTPPIK